MREILAPAALFSMIKGGIFLGVFTAAEGGGFGAGGALLIAKLRRRMSVKAFFESLLEAGRMTATIFSVGFGALTLNQFVNISGAPQEVLGFITSLGLGPWGVIGVILCCYVILGMVEPPPLKWSAPIVRKAEDQR